MTNNTLTKLKAIEKALSIMTKCAYPVSTEINQRGYNWSEAYLDQALSTAQEALTLITELIAEQPSEDDCRKSFEEWHLKTCGNFLERWSDGCYRSDLTHNAWTGYQAAYWRNRDGR